MKLSTPEWLWGIRDYSKPVVAALCLGLSLSAYILLARKRHLYLFALIFPFAVVAHVYAVRSVKPYIYFERHLDRYMYMLTIMAILMAVLVMVDVRIRIPTGRARRLPGRLSVVPGILLATTVIGVLLLQLLREHDWTRKPGVFSTLENYRAIQEARTQGITVLVPTGKCRTSRPGRRTTNWYSVFVPISESLNREDEVVEVGQTEYAVAENGMTFAPGTPYLLAHPENGPLWAVFR